MFKKSTIIAFLLGWGVLGFFIGPRDVIGWLRGGRA